MTSHQRRRLAALSHALLNVLWLLSFGCAEKVPDFLGQFDGKTAAPVHVETALRSPELLEPLTKEAAPHKVGLPTTVMGTVREVCPTSGCWIRIGRASAPGDGGEGGTLHVELLGFTAPRSLAGRRCFVQGKVVRDSAGNVKMLARGIAMGD